jgi:hypothetical protein
VGNPTHARGVGRTVISGKDGAGGGEVEERVDREEVEAEIGVAGNRFIERGREEGRVFVGSTRPVLRSVWHIGSEQNKH